MRAAVDPSTAAGGEVVEMSDEFSKILNEYNEEKLKEMKEQFVGLGKMQFAFYTAMMESGFDANQSLALTKQLLVTIIAKGGSNEHGE